MRDAIKKSVDLLYSGRSRRAVQFRYGVIGFDAATILFFIATAAADQSQPVALANTQADNARADDFLKLGKDKEARLVINDAFLITLVQILVDTPAMTATEVLERVTQAIREREDF